MERAWDRITEEVAAGRQAYVVAPRISSTEATSSKDPASTTEEVDATAELEDLPPPTSVEDLYAELSSGPLAELEVEMLHGQLAARGEGRGDGAGSPPVETDVLVSTTVIEVGVDVPNASMMVICDADRFGISQLHQLRGRIGRGEHPGVCLLLSAADPDSRARERLAAVAATRDGFALAEVDLEQRREGDVLGASQSGQSVRACGCSGCSTDADLIGRPGPSPTGASAADPELVDPGLADIVTAVELRAAGEWLERS